MTVLSTLFGGHKAEREIVKNGFNKKMNITWYKI